jgi:membrane protease subunit HflK
MDTDKNIQRIGLLNWLVPLVAAVVCQLVARQADSATGQVGVVFLGLGFLVAVLSYFHMRLEERERLEKMEFDELLKSKSSATLFTSQDAEALPAQRARQQFEKYFVPAFTILLFLAQVGAVYFLWKWLPTANPPKKEFATLALALYAVFALVLYLLGKYSSGLARLDRQRLLRPGAGYLMLGAFVCFVIAVTEAVAWFDFPNVDRHVARGLCVVIGLAAVETLISLVLEIYRPRLKGALERPLYESRVIGLLGQPGGLITTAAQALDYQFGFKVSETWFYKFLERALAWLVLIQLGVLWLSTMFVFVEPHEQALVERFGRPVATLSPGPHLKLPWPISKAYRYRTGEIQSFTVGSKHGEEGEKEHEAEERVVLWTRRHYEEDHLLVASREQALPLSPDSSTSDRAIPVNLLSVSVPVHFIIRDVKAWAYHHADAKELLERIATREVVRYLVSVDVNEIMGPGRLEAAQVLRERIQKRADAEPSLGVEIVFVGLHDIHPPVGGGRETVASAFEAVIGAAQEREAKIHTAQGEAAESIPKARAEAAKKLADAKAEATRKGVLAAALASQFTNRLSANAASPEIFRLRTYLETLAKAIGPAYKYVLLTTNSSEIINLNLEHRIGTELYRELTVPTPEKK